MGKRKNMEEIAKESTLQPENISQKPPFWQNPKIPIVVALVVVALTISAAAISFYLKTTAPLPLTVPSPTPTSKPNNPIQQIKYLICNLTVGGLAEWRFVDSYTEIPYQEGDFRDYGMQIQRNPADYAMQMQPPSIEKGDDHSVVTLYTWSEYGGLLSVWEVTIENGEVTFLRGEIIQVAVGHHTPLPTEGHFLPTPGALLVNEGISSLNIEDKPYCRRYQFSQPENQVTVTTDKTEYEQGEEVRITVKNNLEQSVCFWYCNPYYLEKKNGQWQKDLESVRFCEDNYIEECLPPAESKIFEFPTAVESYSKQSGIYRVVIDLCVDCQVEEDSVSIKTISSNEFRIKEKEEPECYQDPRKALDDFLSYLHTGQYEKAAKLYAGNYPFERAHISPDQMTEKEHINFIAWFLADFCYGYGTCLEHEIVGEEEVLSEDTVLFGVQFLEENGELFEFVAPGGVDRRVATEFGLRVVEIDGCYRSVDAPPITP